MGRRLIAQLGSLLWLSRLHPALRDDLEVRVREYHEMVTLPETGERVPTDCLSYQERQRLAPYLSYDEVYRPVTALIKARDGSVLLPRHAVAPDRLVDLGYDIVFSRGPRKADPDLVARGKEILLRNEVQRNAYESVFYEGNGFLQLAPGKGKTVIALKLAAQWGQPTLVFVDNGGLMTQWRERIQTFWGLDASEIGEIRSHFSRWSWRGRPISLAIYDSFFQQCERGNVSREFFDYFGTVIWDEAQTAKSPSHFPSLSLFDSKRLGLSATPGTDGSEKLLFMHTGAPSYVNLESDLLPDCYFVPVPLKKHKEFNTRGKERYGKMATYCLGGPRKKPDANYVEAVKHRIRELRKHERKILVVTPRSGFGREFFEEFPDAVVIDQGTAFDDRDEVLNSSDLVFVTTQLGERALDRPDLDALVLVYPVGKNAQDRVAQAVGRVLRLSPGKKTPVVYAFFPENTYGIELARANEDLFRSLRYRVVEGAPKRAAPRPNRSRAKKAVIPRRDRDSIRATGSTDRGAQGSQGAAVRTSPLSRLKAKGTQ